MTAGRGDPEGIQRRGVLWVEVRGGEWVCHGEGVGRGWGWHVREEGKHPQLMSWEMGRMGRERESTQGRGRQMDGR